MKVIKKIFNLIAVSSFLFASCNSDGCGIGTKVSVDVKNSSNIDISKGNFEIRQLDNLNDSTQLGNIKDVSFCKNYLFIEATNGMFKYNQDNNAIMSFSSKGRAQSEYTDIWSHWIDVNNLCIYDMNANKILSYNIDSDEYVNTVKVSPNADSSPFQSLVKYKDGYIGKRVYDGGIGNIDELALYDSNYNFIKPISSFKIKSGVRFYDQFAKYNDYVLYNRYFDNTIYQVDAGGVKERYIIDFNEYNIPNYDSFVDEYEIINFLHKNDNSKYASLISNMYESDSYLTFNFVSGGNSYLTIYNKATATTNSVCIKINDEKMGAVYCYQDKIYLLFTSNYRDSIATITIHDLLKLI